MRILTIGHSTHTRDAFVRLLTAADVTRLVDIRSVPRSRANPQFNVDVLPEGLAAAGIGYTHLKALGGLRGRQDLGFPSPNGYWRVGGFRNYADYALTPPFRKGLAVLLELGRRDRCAVMCAEALWWQCHRRIVADYLLAAGVAVEHVMADGTRRPAEMTPAAAVQPDGAVHYPPAQPELL